MLKGKLFLIILGVFLLNVNLDARSSRPPSRVKVAFLKQPDGKSFKVFHLLNSWFSYEYITLRKEIPIIKNKNGYYVLATRRTISPDYTFEKMVVVPTTVRAESPHAYKKKIAGKWHFFIPGSNTEVPFNTGEAILPDWPFGSLVPNEFDIDPSTYFTGKFKPDGSAIYYSTEKKKTPYRAPFAGSTDFWFLMIPFLLLWKRKIC